MKTKTKYFRLDISRLTRNRAIYMKLGLIISLSFVIGAFNWTAADKASLSPTGCDLGFASDITIIRTLQQEKKRLPPPVIKAEEIILEIDNKEFTNDIPEKPDDLLPLDEPDDCYTASCS